MENPETHQEIWHVEANGQLFESNFAEMTQWIAEGSLLRIDRVRKGNLRWIEAGKVPALVDFFNAKDSGEPLGPVVTTTTVEIPAASPFAERKSSAFPATSIEDNAATPRPADTAVAMCAMHADVEAAFICETCSNSFCKACPAGYGASVKICPFCGAMCKSLAQAEKTRVETQTYAAAMESGFGFSDFASAIAYPFRFKSSLIMGGIMFALFSIGKSAGGFGSIFLAGAAIFCYMLTNTLTFGILANTVENFSQGKIGENFMPAFDDFSIWDDVVHPFFLSIGVYIASFGPLVAVIAVAFFMMMNAVKTEVNKMQTGNGTVPQLAYAANAAQQSQKVQELLQKTNDMQKKRMEAIEQDAKQHQETLEKAWAAAESGEETTITRSTPGYDEEKEFAELNQMIQDTRKAQLEGAIGKTPETVEAEQTAMLSKLLGYGAIFILLAGLSLLWGLFYFPAACAVAGYTRSFVATLNPAVGFDTIRRLGLSYVKILLMAAAILIASAIIGVFLNAVFLVFNLPTVGNLPATFIGSLFTFYFSVVFSCIIGFAIYKAGDRLKLYS